MTMTLVKKYETRRCFFAPHYLVSILTSEVSFDSLDSRSDCEADPSFIGVVCSRETDLAVSGGGGGIGSSSSGLRSIIDEIDCLVDPFVLGTAADSSGWGVRDFCWTDDDEGAAGYGRSDASALTGYDEGS